MQSRQGVFGKPLLISVMAAAALVAAGCRADKKAATEAPATPARTLLFELPASLTQPTPAPTASVPAEASSEEEAAAVSPPAFPTPSEGAQAVRMIIAAAKVDASLHVKGVNARNEMENPDGKDSVAWYNFSERPGFGANAVFSGHLDWYTGERGVFWYLKNIKEGDDILIRLSDGMELTYRVTTSTVYKTESIPVAEVVGPTDTESVTLITCEGVFNRRAQDYSDRRVVRAERVG